MHQIALAPPGAPWSRKRSLNTVISSQNQMIHMNRTNIVQSTSPSA